MRQLHDWLIRKLQTPRRRLRTPSRAVGEFRRQTGGRLLFGRVTLSAVPAPEFEYVSQVKWPDNGARYEQSVLDGILAIVLIDLTPPVLGVAITLEEIVWHENDSCPLAYGMAARQAVERILYPEHGEVNYGSSE